MVELKEPRAAAENYQDYNDYVHTGPDTLAGRYLRMYWQPVLRSDDLKPGRAIPSKIMSEDFTLYRGESGKAHALAFRCAHRGTQLSTGWVEGEDLRCFYHGWKYDPSGQCVEQPAEPEPFCQRIRIRSYPTQEYLGLIFVYFGEGAAPALPRYPEMETEGILEVYASIWPVNFFNSIDQDSVHSAFVHARPGNDWRQWAEGSWPIVTAEETDFGMRQYTTRPFLRGQSGNGANGARIPKTDILDRGMPNVTYFRASVFTGRERASEAGRGDEDRLRFAVPIDDYHSWRFASEFVHLTGDAALRYQEKHASRVVGMNSTRAAELGEKVLRGEMTMDEAREHDDFMWLVANVEDVVVEAGQGAIADRTENEHLGREDTGVAFFRNLWVRELRALAEGRPLKQWRPPSSG